MPTSLADPEVSAVLQAAPSVTQTASGVTLPYPFPSPADWRDRWIYFLLVDRFDHPTAHPRGSDPYNEYQGGSFAGIRQRLPYLQRLGVGAIWLSPVLLNPLWLNQYWGGYGVYDFLRIDPRFCSDPALAEQDPTVADREFRELVDEIHAHGMHVILDIVLNHTGDLFNYEGARDAAPWNGEREYSIYWRDGHGTPHGDWTEIRTLPAVPREAGVWPRELQRNDYFRRRGTCEGSGDTTRGDFDRLKELVTEYLVPETGEYPVRNALIRAYQYLIARFDLDGFRIDTLQYVESDFSRVFGNAMREYALSIGKKNFFTFGEVWQDDDEERIAEFVGRNTHRDQELIGVDAALDFPMRLRLQQVCKGFAPPSELAAHFDRRREALKKIVSSHGDAGRYYVTFLDNHDLNERFHHPDYPGQTRLALTCLMTLQGIPCLYYGTEQGLHGRGDRREAAREALWGHAAFDEGHDLFQLVQQLSQVRLAAPALRYGRQYFRPCSGNGLDWGYSPYRGGVLAFSRVLNDREVLVVANTGSQPTGPLYVAVDFNLNPKDRPWQVLFPRPWQGQPPVTTTHGKFRAVQVDLGPMEAVVLE